MPSDPRTLQLLQTELKKLKGRFDTGHGLTVVYLPGEKRVNDSGNPLSGEIQNNNILIYETDSTKALETLRHEFIEYLINQISQDYLIIINDQNRIIQKLLYRSRENLVNKLSKVV